MKGTHKHYKWEVLALLWMAYLLNQADRQVFNTVLPQVRDHFEIGDTEVGWIGTIFNLCYALMVPLGGMAGDRLSRKWVVTIAILFWSVATMFTGLASGVVMLILLRSIATGGGEAFFGPANYSLLGQYHTDTRARAMSIHQTSYYVGVVLAGVLAGYIAEKLGWEYSFIIFGAAGVVWGIVMALRLKDKKEEIAGHAGNDDGSVIPSAVEESKPGILDGFKIVFTTPTALILTIGFSGFIFVITGYMTWVPTFLQEEFNMSVTNAGLHSMLWTYIAAFAGVLLAGTLSDKMAVKSRKVRMDIQGLGLILGALFLFFVKADATIWVVYACFAGWGFFRAFFDANIYTVLYDVTPSKLHASCSSALITTGFAVGALAPVILGAMKESMGSLSSTFPVLGGIWVVCGLMMLWASRKFYQKDYDKYKQIMKAELKARKPKAGLLLIASPRFKNLYGPQRGTYGERKEKAVKEILATMDFLDVVYPGITYEREDAQKAMDLFYAEKVDFIYAEFLSWSEDFAWIRFLRDCPEIPIIFCNVAKPKMTFETTLDEDDFVDYLCAGTLVGSLEGSGSIKRVPRKNVKTIMGTREQVTEQLKVYANAAKTRAILRNSTVGLMANMNEAMWSTYIDNYDLFTKIGPEIHYLPYSDYGIEIDNLTDEEVKEYADELTGKYRMMDDVEYDKFIGCVKATLGIKKLAQKNDIDCYVYNDIDQATFKTAGCRAGFYPQWFNENVSVLVPEADIGAGIITYVLKLMTGKNVNFVEPFHIEDDFGTFAGGHAGPNDHNDPQWQENVIISRDVRFAKTNWKYAGAPFAWYRFSPGMKTVAGLYEEDGKYKLITFLAESLSEKDTPQSDKKHLLATYSHTIFKPVVPVKELWEQVLRIGATQHYAIVDGDWRKELEDFAEIMGFEFYNIK